MAAILKFFLPETPNDEPVMLPHGKIFAVGYHERALCIWIDCEPDAPRARGFLVRWTGQTTPIMGWRHVGSAFGGGHVLVCHVFARAE